MLYYLALVVLVLQLIYSIPFFSSHPVGHIIKELLKYKVDQRANWV